MGMPPGETGVPRRKRLTREQSREQTRERLLEAASEVFLRKGFVGTSVEEIAETAGYSKGAVYANFAGKDDLFLAVFGQHYAQAAPVWAPVLAPDLPATERQAGIVRLLTRATEDLKEQARTGRYTWTLLELEFVVSAFRSPETRAKLANYYRDFRSNSEPLTVNVERTWLLQALGLGISILVCVDPDATPAGIWDLSGPILFSDAPGDTEGTSGTGAVEELD